MPKINETLLHLKGFQYATSLGLNMEYYHILLTDNSTNLCTIIIPWEKYCYKRRTIRVTNLPEIFQQEINGLFREFLFICAYIYKLVVLTRGDWTDHVQKLELTLTKLKEKGFKYNIERSFLR